MYNKVNTSMDLVFIFPVKDGSLGSHKKKNRYPTYLEALPMCSTKNPIEHQCNKPIGSTESRGFILSGRSSSEILS